MDTDTTTNQVGDEGATDTDTDALNGVDEAGNDTLTDQQSDEDGNLDGDDAVVAGNGDEEEEEIDLDGVKLKLKKADAERVRKSTMLNADYTRKTQSLADERKTFEAERDSVSKASEQEIQARGQLHVIDLQLEQYAKVDWRQLMRDDPFEHQEKFTQYQLLKDARSGTVDFISTLQHERQSKEQQADAAQRQEVAKLLDHGTPELKKAIPDWSRAKAAKLIEDGRKHFPKANVDGIDSDTDFIILNAAVNWANHEASRKKARNLQQAQEVTPAAKASSGKSSVPPGQLDDRLNTDVWIKRRDEQTLRRA